MSQVAVPAGSARPRRPRLRQDGWLESLLWGAGFPLAVFVVWEALAAAGRLNPMLFSRPSAVLSAGWQQAESGALLNNLLVSLGEAGAGLLLAILLGLPIGVAMGAWRRVDYSLEPLVVGAYSAPIVALFPLLILMFGLGFTAMLVLVVLFAVFPIIVNTALGVRMVDPVLVRTARSFGASPAEVFAKVVLPAALPSILAGLRLATGRALVGVIVAELFMGAAGLGFSIGYAAVMLRTADIFFGILVIGALGLGLNALVGALERHWLRHTKA